MKAAWKLLSVGAIVIPLLLSAALAAPASLANPGLLRTLDRAQRTALVKRGFVVGGPNARTFDNTQFYSLYKDNLGRGIPSFVTSDVLLHTFHIMYDNTLAILERSVLAPQLATLTNTLMQTATFQYGEVSSPTAKTAAKANLAFLSVAQRLQQPKAPIPSIVAKPVAAELALIRAHRGFASSPIFGYPVDYSQFIPRGHYTLTAALTRYFLAMMWYGRILFPVNGPGAKVATLEALLLTRAVTLVPRSNILWSSIFNPVGAWVGTSDDLTIRQYASTAQASYGKGWSLAALANAGLLGKFMTRVNALPAPRINGDFTTTGGQAKQDKGLRLFPQRFTADAAVLQAMIWDKVGTNQKPRIWPMGLDVAAVFGSSKAARILTSPPLNQQTYAHYTQQLSKLHAYYSSLPAKTWTQNLYWRWLDTLRAVWTAPPKQAPRFTHTAQWSAKQVAAGLGSWAELKHDTILYSKQPYGLGAGGAPPAVRTPYVEPVPAIFSRLYALVEAYKSVLARGKFLGRLRTHPDTLPAQQARYLYPNPPAGESGYRAAIDVFAGLVATAQRVAAGELYGKAPSAVDTHTLLWIGPTLETLTDFFQDNGAGTILLPPKKEVPVIADVFTDPISGNVLEEGVGNVLPIYVTVVIRGKQWLTRGATFSYYEFHWPAGNRLTDDAWRAMKKRPPMPSWTKQYITP